MSLNLDPDRKDKITSGEHSEDCYNWEESAEQIAKSRGQIVVLPKPNQIQLDLDTDAAYREFLRRWEAMELEGDVEVIQSKTPGHRHVYITFHRWFQLLERNAGLVRDAKNEPVVISEELRIALQACLGSDIIREFLNMRRMLWGIANPCRLFEPDPALVNENTQEVTESAGDIF